VAGLIPNAQQIDQQKRHANTNTMSTRPGSRSIHARTEDGRFPPGAEGFDQVDFEAPLVTPEELAFERLVTEMAGRFAGIEPSAVDEALVDSLRRMVETLGLDRGVVWRRVRGELNVLPTHHWVRSSTPSVPASLRVSDCPWVFSKLDAGEPVCFGNLDEVPNRSDRECFRQNQLQSAAILPLTSSHDGETQTALAMSSLTEPREWSGLIVERLRLASAIIGQAIAQRDAVTALRGALDEVRRLRERLADDQTDLRKDGRNIRISRLIVSESPAIKRALAQLEQVALTPATVLLLGETGSGKEVFAQAIHDLSPRHQRPMVKVSCAAIPAALIESELFGRERGAYTGALSRQIGRFEAAHQSTLFLDEIGDLPPEVQVKLLRVLQERVVERLGSTQSIKVDVRIIAATNRNLERAVEDKTFREDLFYRLNVFPIVVPPLRERIEDIPGLAWAFVDEFSKSFGRSIVSISKESIRELQRYAWPGNVRELRNIIERAVIVATGPQLEISAPTPTLRAPQTSMTLVDLEVEHIRTVLESTNWRVRGAGGAAQRLGLKPTTLESRMARFGIKRRPA
jgi:formate hydrogenlyase transcriptional activator